MFASRGFVFDKPFDPHGSGELTCKCEFVPGVEGAINLEGFDPQEFYDKWKHPEDYPELIEARASAKSERKMQRKLAAQEASMAASQPTSREAISVLSSSILSENIDSNTVEKVVSLVDNAVLSGDQRRINAAKVFAWALEQVDAIAVESSIDSSMFSAVDNMVRLTTSGSQSPRTILHEFFHAADWFSDVTYSVEKIGKTGIEKHFFNTGGSYTSLLYGKERVSGSLSRLMSTNAEGVTRSWSNLKKSLGATTDSEVKERITRLILDEGVSDEGLVSLSDVIHSSSNGLLHFGYGHFPDRKTGRTYWNKDTRVLEFVADYCASAVSGNSDYALICKLFPREAAFVDEMIGVIADEF